MKKLTVKENNFDYISEAISGIYLNSIKTLVIMILLTIIIALPLNWISRPSVMGYIMLVFIVVLLLSFIIFALTNFINKSRLSTSSKLLFFACFQVLLINIIVMVALPLNNLLLLLLSIAIFSTSVLFKIHHQIILQSFTVAFITYYLTFGALSNYLLPQRISIFLLTIITCAISYFIRSVIINLIMDLVERSKLQEEANKEIKSLNDDLELKVEERTSELEATMQELSATLETLENTQDRLMKTKSMESFLALARGISHQINTPLGVSLTSSGYIEHLTGQIEKSVKENTLTQKDLSNSIYEIQDACAMLNENIKRSIKVVEELKRFTLYEPTSSVNLKKLLDSFVAQLSLDEYYRRANIDIIVESDIEMSIPKETFKIILKTFVENSIEYCNSELIDIKILISEFTRNFTIEISDSGPGIDEEIRDKIFEPFFSTSPHKLGMGLFIAENIVHHTFNGQLYLDKEYNLGTKIIFIMPKHKIL